MKSLSLFKVFESCYCKIIFLISLIIVSLFVPKKLFYGIYSLLAISFIILSSLVITCFIRGLKEKVYSAKMQGASFIGILGIIFGFGAIQACTIGAPVCGTSIGMGFLAIFFPNLAINFLEEYSIIIIFLSLILQIFILYILGCFKIKKG